MVRIVNQKSRTEPAVLELTEKSKVLLQVIGSVIADKPHAIRQLLEDYGIRFLQSPGEKDLVRTLLDAVSECDPQFNRELAGLLLDCSLENAYDGFDFKSVFSKGGESNTDPGASSNATGGGLWGNVANAVGKIGEAIGQGVQGKQAREQATTNTLQGIYAYKSQLANNEQGKRKNNLYILLAMLTVVGLSVTALVIYSRKTNQAGYSNKPLTP